MACKSGELVLTVQLHASLSVIVYLFPLVVATYPAGLHAYTTHQAATGRKLVYNIITCVVDGVVQIIHHATIHVCVVVALLPACATCVL